MIAKPLVFVAVLLAAAIQASANPAPSYQQGAKLVGTGAVGNPQQGRSVALSADGNTVIVGAIADNSFAGAAWVYVRSGGVWSQQGTKLVGTGAVGNAQQGNSVALSADGNTAMVGGPTDNTSAGAAWVFTRTGSVWSQQGTKLVGTGAVGNAQQGISVALSADGNTAIVGGNADNGSAGAMWVFTRSGSAWSQQGTKLVGTGAVGNAAQGISVALSADGNTALVGGGVDNSQAGAAWVFTRTGITWSQQGTKLNGTGAAGNAQQGYSVALAADGNTAAWGAYLDNISMGAAWVFTRAGSVWSQQGPKLVGTGSVGSPQQGRSITISGDGNTLAVGGYNDNSQAGAVWAYTRSGGAWSQQGAKLVGTGAVGNAEQGFSLALSSDGNTLAEGSGADNGGVGAEWMMINPAPRITAIHDVLNDQGGKVNLRWTASLLDNEPGNPMDAYWVWRQVPVSMAQQALANGAKLVGDGAAARAGIGKLFRTTHDAANVYYWEYAASQVADGYPAYSFTAQTTSDSLPGSNPYTLFMIEAKQLSTGARWASDPDSGYSVDNVPPAEPAPFVGNYSAGTTTVHWKENVEPDLSHYNLYRGASSGFVPGSGNRIASLSDTSYADGTPGAHFYKLSALDVHGNESAFNLLTPQQVGAVPGEPGPGLWLGRAAPNPARGTSVVHYSLAIAGPAELSVFDARGARVRRLLHGNQPAGEGRATWDGRNERGAPVAGGEYFLRLTTAGGPSLSERLLWIR